jgi:hypothetical protein
MSLFRKNQRGIESTSDLPELWDDATSWHVDVGAIGATPPAELMHAAWRRRLERSLGN